MLTATARACRELGPGQAIVAEIVGRAGVSRRTFYELFRDREDCLQAALEEALRRASARVLPAYRAQKDWREAIRSGLQALLAFLDEDRAFGTLLIVDSLAAGDQILQRRAQVISKLAAAVDLGARQPRANRRLSKSTALGAVGGVLCILHTRLLAAPTSTVSPLLGELTALVMTPYLGAGAAEREAARAPVAAERKIDPAADGDPLAEADLRLTYRTVSVLRALAQLSMRAPTRRGPSNRQVAEAAGIGDQGQASKLLARLAAHGLIEEAARRRSRGEPHRWRLTPKGRRLEAALRGPS